MNSSSVPTPTISETKCESVTPSILLTNCDSGGADVTSKENMTMPKNDSTANTYNLNVNVNLSAANAAVSNLLAAESACSTPRTPEILNSLIAMTNPMDQYSYNNNEKCATAGYKSGSCNDSNSSNSNGSPVTSPASGTPPSIQKTCSDLIKAGLKLSIESKRKMSGSECSDPGLGCVKRLKKEEIPSDEEYDSGHTSVSKSDGLTPEDEERRRRRRERNKIAATKCRLKKRERTVNLVTESEVLENQNHDLKTQLQELEVQRRQLIDMLSLHTPSCVKNNSNTSPTTPYNPIRPPYDSPNGYPNNYDTASPYIRPESANILASSYTCIAPLPIGDSSIDTISSLENSYIVNNQLIDNDYHRPDSVLSLPVSSDVSYATTDFIPKGANLLSIDQVEAEYYEQEMNYHQMTTSHNQQCHNYGGATVDAQSKMNNQGLNNGCLA